MNVHDYRAHVAAAVRRWFPHARIECAAASDVLSIRVVVKGRTPGDGLVRRVPLIGAPDAVEARARLALESLLEELGTHRLVLRADARRRVPEARRPDVVVVDRHGRVTAERAHELVESFPSLDAYLLAYDLAHGDLTPA